MRHATLRQTLLPRAWFRPHTLSPPLRYTLSVLAVVLAWALRLALDPLLGNAQAFSFFYVAVALIAWWDGWRPGLLALLLGYLAGHWFFLPPRHALGLENFADVLELLTYFFVGGTLLLLTTTLRKAEARAKANARALRREKQELETQMAERLRAEAALRQSEHKFRFLIENALVGVYIIQAGRFTYVNPKFAHIFGYSPAELTASLPVSRLVAEPDRPRVAEMLRRRLAGEITQVHYTFQALRKDATTLEVEVLGALMTYQDQPAVIGTLVDVTERNRAEAALRQAKEDLARANADLDRQVQERTARLRETLAELEGFSYALIHDLRAPLRAMQSYAEIIKAEAGPRLRPEETDLLTRIRVASNRMDHLITDSLNYTRVLREELPLSPVNLGQLLRGMLDTYPSLHPPQADVVLEFGDLLVQGNEAALTQVFSHLLGNAVKFVAPGVHPRARLWAEPSPFAPESPPPSHHASRLTHQQSAASPHHSTTPPLHQSMVRVFVADNGLGISQEAQQRIFGLFQRSTARTNSLAPASAWPWSANPSTAWVAASASPPSPAKAPASGSNSLPPRPPAPSSPLLILTLWLFAMGY